MFNNNNTPFSMPVAPIGYGGGCNNGGFGGWGDDWIALIIFAMIFGWGNGGWGNGFGNNGGGAGMLMPFLNGTWTNGALTRADLCQDMNFNNLESGVRGISQGICDSTFALNNSINSVNTNMLNGFHGVDNAICNLGYTTQQGFNATQVAMMQGQNALQSQLAQCCCDNRVGQMQIQNQMQADTCALTNTMNNNTRDIIDSNNCGTRAILERLNQFELNAKDEKIAGLREKVNDLQLQASQAAQNNFIAANQQAQTAELIRRLGMDCPQPAYVVQPPQPVTFPVNCCGQFNGYNNNNGCGNGCNGCNC